jgi:hypothetical protein
VTQAFERSTLSKLASITGSYTIGFLPMAAVAPVQRMRDAVAG